MKLVYAMSPFEGLFFFFCINRYVFNPHMNDQHTCCLCYSCVIHLFFRLVLCAFYVSLLSDVEKD